MKKKLIGRVLELVKPYRRRLALAMFSMVMVSLMGSAQAYLVKPLLDQIFVEKNVQMLNILPLALVVVFLLKVFFTTPIPRSWISPARPSSWTCAPKFSSISIIFPFPFFTPPPPAS